MSARRQQGLSLVELMVGIAIGLIVVATASTLMVQQLNDTRRLRIETQVEQDLRAAADLVVRDLRRAGHTRNPAGVSAENPYVEVNANAEAVTYARVEDADDTVSANERSGVKLENGTLKLLLGDGGWQALTDPEVVRVTSFRVALTNHAVPLAGYCTTPCPAGTAGSCPPQQEVREARIELAGVATRDPRVKRSLQADVRLRNDRITGHCGA